MIVLSYRMTEHVAVIASHVGEVGGGQPSGCTWSSCVRSLDVTCGFVVVFGWSVVENINMQS